MYGYGRGEEEEYGSRRVEYGRPKYEKEAQGRRMRGGASSPAVEQGGAIASLQQASSPKQWRDTLEQHVALTPACLKTTRLLLTKHEIEK